MSFGKLLKLLVCSAFLAGPAAWAQMGEVGEAVPDFTLMDLDDQEHTLSDYSGKAVLLFLLTPS